MSKEVGGNLDRGTNLGNPVGGVIKGDGDGGKIGIRNLGDLQAPQSVENVRVLAPYLRHVLMNALQSLISIQRKRSGGTLIH